MRFAEGVTGAGAEGGIWTVEGVTVQVKRSPRRRTLALQVKPGEVTLHAPARVPEALLLAFLNDKREWAAGHLSAYAARAVPASPLGEGSLLPFLGQTLTLHQRSGVRKAVREGHVLWVSPLPAEDRKGAVEAWYRQAALEPYRTLVQDAARQLGADSRLRSVRVSSTRTRWGSCTAAGDIRLHWALARAPYEVTRYVALHEAAHLLELNHSPRYWAQVGRVMPDYSQWQRWLREEGHSLKF